MCCARMFYNCTQLTTLPKLKATTLSESCYSSMFYGCSKIKLSTTQTGEYQTPYRIPISGTGTYSGSQSYYPTNNMFINTGGTYQYASLNTTYYTSNELV